MQPEKGDFKHLIESSNSGVRWFTEELCMVALYRAKKTIER